MMEFPRLVYRSAKEHKAVNSQAEHGSALSDGWFDSVVDIGKPKPVIEQPVDNSAPTRAELEQKATEIGIKFDGRTSDDKLRRTIENALKE